MARKLKPVGDWRNATARRLALCCFMLLSIPLCASIVLETLLRELVHGIKDAFLSAGSVAGEEWTETRLLVGRAWNRPQRGN